MKLSNKRLHATYNNIQYIMSKTNGLQNFTIYQKFFSQKLQALQSLHSKQFQKKRLDMETLSLQNNINNSQIFFNVNDIATAATSKLDSINLNRSETVKSQLANIYSKLLKGAEQGSTVYSDLLDLIKIKNKMLPKGSRISIDRTHQQKVENLLKDEKSFRAGNFYNTLGDVGELTSVVAATSIADSLLEDLEKQLNLTHGQLKVKAKIKHTAKERLNGTQVQTDNKLILVFDINDNNLIGKINMPAGGLKMEVNLSDKAKKNLFNIDSKRRSSTGTITFRSTTMNQFFNDGSIDAATKKAMYNLISFHRQGDKLISFMYTPPGFALREYIGYKMASQMFLNKEELNQVHFTVYGDKIFAEETVFDKLLLNKFRADIEYWSLKSLVGKYPNLEEGTAEANRMIRDMKVMLRTSLKF